MPEGPQVGGGTRSELHVGGSGGFGTGDPAGAVLVGENSGAQNDGGTRPSLCVTQLCAYAWLFQLEVGGHS